MARKRRLVAPELFADNYLRWVHNLYKCYGQEKMNQGQAQKVVEEDC
jgi:hypothetical protein